MIKKILLALLLLLAVIQFIRPAKNISGDNRYHLSTKYPIPQDVTSILEVACYDCHSNHTRYPWYAHVQPSAWWLANHVREGKENLNFSEFTLLKIAVQNKKFEEIAELVEEKAMPLPSYTWFGLHPDANLSDAQRQTLINWANTQMNALRDQYPPDSLVLKKR